MNITMIGAGYVGLTTGACLAELGHRVICVDQDERRVAMLKRGEIPIYEPGLEELVAGHGASGALSFSADSEAAVRNADAVFLAVGTPSRRDGDVDLSFVEAAARQIAVALPPNCVVVVKSTVPVGTCRFLREVIAEARAALDFSVASNPEFLREGSAVGDFLKPDRVVIGSDDARARALLEKIYAPFKAREVPILCTTNSNAELIKYSANAFLALKIGFINDVANLCEQAGGDVGTVALGIGLDKRIGSSFLAAGPGFGGSCFPKDTRTFAATGRRFGTPQSLVETLIESNEARRRRLAERILAALGPRARGARVAVLGLAFKADTDDIREAASLTIIPLLQEAGCTIRASDPKANDAAAGILKDVQFFADPLEAAKGADLVVVLTEWEAFRRLDLGRLAQAMRGDTLADFRNLWRPQTVAQHGLRYLSVGRPAPADTAKSRKVGGKAATERAAAVRSPV
ncbi:MAG TPA: UDP-glucose/GDP-mannose dehydrogenase family protein [Mesorhizobium sp.]|jgi:UDPglucose 6-dehydrogenase|nr:UDP-glucose/GDP-mannose dehydrogenase family protein [Mesorhizobium sp.]